MHTTQNITFTANQIACFYSELVPQLKQREGGEWRGPCPIHKGQRDSFAVNPDTGQWHCHSECRRGGGIYDLYQALTGITFPEAKQEIHRLMGIISAPEDSHKSWHIVATYDYLDEAGQLLFQTVRTEPKDFRQRRPNGKGGWAWNLKGTRVILYRLPELTKTTGPVYIPEGEKDVDRLAGWGLTATCNPMGASKWGKIDQACLQYLAGREIVILPDNDQVGRDHACQIASSLASTAKLIKVVELPGLPEKGDVSDWMAKGGTREQLEALVEKAPPWQPVTAAGDTIYQALPQAPSLGAFLPTASCEGLVLPMPWRIDNAGVYFLSVDRTGIVQKSAIAASPFFISSRCVNIDTGMEKLELRYLRDHTWKPLLIERGIALDQRKVVQMADYGLPISSLNSKMVVKYLHDFEAANTENLQRRLTVSGFGWKNGSKDAFFVLRNRTIGREDGTSFEADAIGSERMAQGLRAEGEIQRWIGAIRKVLPYRKVLFAVYSAFVPPLLELLSAPNFIVHFWGQTSVGKTSAISIASSAWGQPALGGMLVGWDATRVSVERVAALFNHIPLFLDDLQVAQDRVAKDTLYMVANGIGRLRGAPKGMQTTAVWRTVAFSTGEKPIAEVTEYDGAQARTLDLFGSPFGSKNAGDVIQSILREIRSHFGQAGPAFVEEVLPFMCNERLGDRLRAEFTEKVNVVASRSRSNVAGRMAQYAAATWLAGEMVEGLFKIGGNPREVTVEIFDEACGNLVETGGDYAQRAMSFIVSWVQGNRNYFDTCEEQATVDKGEVYGVIRDAEYLGILPHKFREIVRRQGWSPNLILQSFQERGWLQANAGYAYPVGFRGQKVRMIKVLWSGVVECSETDQKI